MTLRVPRIPVPTVWLVAFLTGSAVLPAPAQSSPHDHPSVGSVDFPVSCSAPAQAEFNRAVALLHHMTYPQAREAFAKVAAIDPRCSMAHWGIAMTLFQPLWPTRPGPEARARGWQEVQAALALRPPTPRESSFVATAAAFFRDPSASDYWLRIRRWEEATGRLHAAYPGDDEAAAFRALSLLATAPSDTLSQARAEQAAGILLVLYRRHPQHPGVMHYLIHANDAPGRERLSLEVTRKYESVAPENPHALHMPTHIYTRLGDWDAVIGGNRRAAEAALAFPAGDSGQFVWDEFPHATEYLLYAELQKGWDDSAAAQLDRLHRTPRLQPSFKTAFHLASTQARYALERRAWKEAVEIVPREPRTLEWDLFPWPEAIAWFARGLGAAHLGDLDEARASERQIAALAARTSTSGEKLFARNIQILDLELKAWIAHGSGQRDASLALMAEAVGLEASTPKHAVTPGPTLPATELLGDLRLEQGRPAEALSAYRESLSLYPNRFNSLLGAARAAREAGDSSARSFYQQLLVVANAGTREPALSEARSYLRAPQ